MDWSGVQSGLANIGKNFQQTRSQFAGQPQAPAAQTQTQTAGPHLMNAVGGLKNIAQGGSYNRSVVPQGNMQVRQPTPLGPSNPNPGPMPMTVPQ